MSKDSEGKLTCQPIFSRIVSLFAEQNDLMFAVPGGLIGVGTKVDPTLCRADRLVELEPFPFFLGVYICLKNLPPPFPLNWGKEMNFWSKSIKKHDKLALWCLIFHSPFPQIINYFLPPPRGLGGGG